jgi:predicted membrane-bound spermidine synthase
LRRLALALTTLTGAAGLVYEVAWQRYLAILLGSQSEATATVLALFLGGLAVGYAFFGRLAMRLARRPMPVRAILLAYASAEAAIGLYAWGFPDLFLAVRSVASAFPVAPGAFGVVVDALLAALLIGAPTALMGATIPLLTQALSRDRDEATRVHAAVYGLNTAGAFVGALAAGFVLIPLLGLRGVLYAAGTANLLAAALYFWLARSFGSMNTVQSNEAPAAESASRRSSHAA